MKSKAGFFRTPAFWVLHILFFAACLTYTLRSFDTAFPFVDLDVKMSRVEAMKAASKLAGERGLSPGAAVSAYRQAVSFEIDSSTQNFIELEAGGPTELARVLKQGVYTPYQWRVRHFAEGRVNETQLKFRPDGRPYGFWEKLSEDDPGAALSSDAALAIAERDAVAKWSVDLKPYRLAERSQEVRRGKRVDHRFVYEMEGDEGKVGPKEKEGRYRLRLSVSGDRLTEISYFIKVPDGFYRRYAEMRSANGTIASLAFAAIALLYGVLGSGVGIFVLARRHWVQWRMPLIVAGTIAGLGFLDELNQLPLSWMGYDTALSSSAFLLRHLTGAFMSALVELVVLGAPIMAAESLTRRAFPGHPQIWRVFSREAVGSRSVLGRVVGAYLAVGFHFAFVAWIYAFGAKHLGWWNPSEVLFHPDALATYFPWLTSVARSLHAGLWEECLFRAVPLASAALLGARFGRRGLWIATAFILQAVIFGAAHASYPTQPSYARVIELIVPSFTFGGVYLAFGLLPGILMHYVYDVVLFAMPIFLSDGVTAWANGAMVVVLSGLPLWLGLYRRWREGSWTELPAPLWNSGWTPVVAAVETGAEMGSQATPEEARGLVGARAGLTNGQRWAVWLTGIAAVGVWAIASQWEQDAAPLTITREQAVAKAREVVREKGVKLDPRALELAVADASPDEDDLFVWRTSGKEVYRAQSGRYLDPPQWRVRFACFEGDLESRAEEYQVFIRGNGEVFRTRHDYPESKGGASLEEAAARKLAEGALREHYALDPDKLRPISSQQTKRPSRRDWFFVWADPEVKLADGEGRIGIRVAGDEVAGYRRYVDVPEEWSRKERSRAMAMGVARTVCSSLLGLLALGLTIIALHGWIRHVFRLRVFLTVFAALVALGLIGDLNDYPSMLARFATSQSIRSQMTRWLAREAVTLLLTSGLVAVWIGYFFGLRARTRAWLSQYESPWSGYAVGAVISALLTVATRFSQGTAPRLPAVSSAWFPVLDGLGSLSTYIWLSAFLALIFSNAERFIHSTALRRIALAGVGVALGSLRAESSFQLWASSGAAYALGLIALDAFLARTGTVLLGPIVGAVTILGLARGLFVPGQPGMAAAAGLGIVLVAGFSWKTGVKND
jgi:hypothetical protein